MTDEEIQAIREYEKLARALPLRAIGKLKFAIDCTTEEPVLSEFLVHRKVVERINLVTAAFRIWGGVIYPTFLRIEVSNVLYSTSTGKENRDSIFAFEPLQIIGLPSPAPVAMDEKRQFSKADAEAFAQLFRNMDEANHGRMKVAFQRLKMFTEEVWPESIIDAMIGFEALYSDKNEVAKGPPIAQKTAKLIGRSHDEATFIESFLAEAYRLRNKIVHGEDVTPDHWVRLTRMVFGNDPDLKTFLSESIGDSDRDIPATAALETLGSYLCRSIQAKLPQK
jgi:hypothetical protein